MEPTALHPQAMHIALELPFTTQTQPFGPQHEVFKVQERMFMLATHLRGQPMVILKADPDKSLLNQQIYPFITPGYHMNKRHWISVYPAPELSLALLEELIVDSWNLVVKKLPLRDQKRIQPQRFR
ncbi:MmcQ/YjbR family DNA-binding protein [Entomohabitans teleogrylli]|uniref:MmcQ/YjbR family DNA-binding protein n=1 Tax=Entomohabitans teleogrylli TaxID=1384589 RepID=UPI00073DA9F6|nr:MmcQ/YjbR family DNA-binding protein [Entomohabitans teleogrylli]